MQRAAAARMERSAIRGPFHPDRPVPNFAPLHPDYDRLLAALADHQLAFQRLVFLIDQLLSRAAFRTRIGPGALCSARPHRRNHLTRGVIVVAGACAEAIVVGGRVRRRWKPADHRRRGLSDGCCRRRSGIFGARMRRRCIGRRKRNRRRGRSLSSRAVLRPEAGKHEAESQERRAFHPHPSSSSGSSIGRCKSIRTHVVVKAPQPGFRCQEYGSQRVTGPPAQGQAW